MIFAELGWIINHYQMDHHRTKLYGDFNNTIIIIDDTSRIDISITPHYDAPSDRTMRVYYDKNNLNEYSEFDFDEYLGYNKDVPNGY